MSHLSRPAAEQHRTLVLALVAAAHLLAPAGALAQSREPSASERFAVESAGGVLGSLAGTAIGIAAFRPDRCPTEDDVVCVLERLSLAGVTSVVGASAGVVLAGRSRETDPSLAGALVGSVAGVAAGIGVLKLTERQRSGTGGRVAGVVLYGLAQGVVSAVGSRIGVKLGGG